MYKHKKTEVNFELQLSGSEDDKFIDAVIVNNTDKKYRIVDVMQGATWGYRGEKYYADPQFLLLAPVEPKAEILIARLSHEDLLSTTFLFIDVYENGREGDMKGYMATLDGLYRMVDSGLQVGTLSLPFYERQGDLVIHNRVKALPDIKPQIRKMVSKRLDKALQIAAAAHAEQFRKGSLTPYIVHPFRVMHIAQQVTNDEDILIACLFHDVLEDVPDKYSREQMMQDFGARVVGFVEDVTKDSAIKDWRKRSEAYLARLENAEEGSVIVSAADKINNLNSILIDYDEIGDEVWKKFNSDKQQQLWWYEAVYTVVRHRLAESPLREAMGRQMKQLRKVIKACTLGQ